MPSKKPPSPEVERNPLTSSKLISRMTFAFKAEEKTKIDDLQASLTSLSVESYTAHLGTGTYVLTIRTDNDYDRRRALGAITQFAAKITRPLKGRLNSTWGIFRAPPPQDKGLSATFTLLED